MHRVDLLGLCRVSLWTLRSAERRVCTFAQILGEADQRSREILPSRRFCTLTDRGRVRLFVSHPPTRGLGRRVVVHFMHHSRRVLL